MSARIIHKLRSLALVLALLALGASALAGSIEVRLNASTKVYSSLTSSAQSVRAPKGLRVSLRAYARGWGKVSYKGRTGYVRLKYLDRVEPLKAYVTRSATVYADASGEKKLTTLSTGALVYALGVDGSYVRITSQNGKWKGYIESGLLTTGRPAAPDAGTVPKGLLATAEGAKASRVEAAIYVAQKLIGAPYAEKPDPPHSFDCASFTWYCYGKAAKGAVKGTSRDQGYDGRYEAVAKPEGLKRGDLVCFNTVDDDDLCDHVGIYLGDGYFLHGSSVAKKVIVSQLTSGYYNRVFSWGRRVFP